MEKITVPYHDMSGSKGTLSFPSHVTRIVIRGAYTYLDLSPLASQESIRSIHLLSCPLESLDLTPALHLNFEFLHPHTSAYTILSKEAVREINPDFTYDRVTFNKCSYYYDEDTIRLVLPIMMKCEENTWKYPFFADNLLVGTNLCSMGPIDVSADKLHNLVEERDILRRREMLISLYCEQIDRGGSTIRADIDSLVEEDGEFARRVTDIVELRKEEIESVRLTESHKSDEVDLRPLWLTAYGFEILSGMNVGLWCSFEEFLNIQHALDKLGYDIELESEEDIASPDVMSRSFRDYILKLAANPGFRKLMMQKCQSYNSELWRFLYGLP